MHFKPLQFKQMEDFFIVKSPRSFWTASSMDSNGKSQQQQAFMTSLPACSSNTVGVTTYFHRKSNKKKSALQRIICQTLKTNSKRKKNLFSSYSPQPHYKSYKSTKHRSLESLLEAPFLRLSNVSTNKILKHIKLIFQAENP